MGPLRFVEKDKENLTKFLNCIALKAKFNDMQVKDVIEVFSLLAWAQKELLQKIDANILEVVAVHPAVPAETSSESAVVASGETNQ